MDMICSSLLKESGVFGDNDIKQLMNLLGSNKKKRVKVISVKPDKNCKNIYNEIEWRRIEMKMSWEGGLIGFMNYGLPKRLYNGYKDEFEEIYKFIDKEKYTKKQHGLINKLEAEIENNFTDKEFTDDEMNSVDYIFDEK